MSDTYSHADIALILKALKFAAEKHRHQRRKDAAGSPYINHPIEVAEKIWNVGEHGDVNTICAALLHDTVEDTDATFEEVDKEFGKVIGDMVREVTDDKSLPKAVRKQKQVEHAPHLSLGAKHIKLGDKASNVKDIHRTPPPDWSKERKAEYLSWTESIITTIRGTNPRMEEMYFEILTEARKSLESEEK